MALAVIHVHLEPHADHILTFMFKCSNIQKVYWEEVYRQGDKCTQLQGRSRQKESHFILKNKRNNKRIVCFFA